MILWLISVEITAYLLVALLGISQKKWTSSRSRGFLSPGMQMKERADRLTKKDET